MSVAGRQRHYVYDWFSKLEMLCVLQVFPEVSLDLTALVNSGPDPVLVEGPSGCGKSSLLLELAHNWNKRSGEGLLYLHMGEQIDGKVSA